MKIGKREINIVSKVLGLNSVIKCGSVSYSVSKISNKEITITDSKNSKTVFSLADFLENLRLGSMTVDKV